MDTRYILHDLHDENKLAGRQIKDNAHGFLRPKLKNIAAAACRLCRVMRYRYSNKSGRLLANSMWICDAA
jgi:hypothetical protein